MCLKIRENTLDFYSFYKGPVPASICAAAAHTGRFESKISHISKPYTEIYI
jgi:hypothetical protein